MVVTPHPDPDQCAVYLKALADPTRLRILNALKAGPLTVGDIALSLEIETALVSHHLRALYHAKIAVTEKEGKYVYYSLNAILFARRGGNEKLDFGCCQFHFGS